MRKIYNEFFHIPEEGQGIIREKVFFARLIVSVALIALCMFAMGYHSYAYFTANISSTGNIMQSATYAFDRSAGTIVAVSGKGCASAGTVEGKYQLEAGTYDLVLSSIADDINGYGRIDILNDKEVTSFFTRQIVQGKPCTIRIQVEATTDIQIIACWGTYATPDNALAEYGNAANAEPEMIVVDKEFKATKATWAEPAVTPSMEENEPVEEAEPVEENPSTQQPLTDEESSPSEENPVTPPSEETEEENSEEINPEEGNPEEETPEEETPEENAGDANTPGDSEGEEDTPGEPTQEETDSENAVEKKEEGV